MMVVKTTGVVNYDLTIEYLVGTNSGTEKMYPKMEIQYVPKGKYSTTWRGVALRLTVLPDYLRFIDKNFRKEP